MKVLVTGGTGFLGKRLALRLKSKGYHVAVIGRNQEAGHSLEAKGIHFIRTAMENREAVTDACEGTDYVFHCAALSSPWGNDKDFYASNVLASRHIIEACKQHGVSRLIHVSTPSLYFDYQDRLNIRETDPLPVKPVNAYARTKRLAEIEFDRACREGLPVITIRPRALFGPGDTAIIPRIIKANRSFGVPLIDGGNAVIDLTYVDNAVDALIKCMHSPPHTIGKKYNITNGEPMRFLDLIQRLFHGLEIPLKTRNLRFSAAYRAAHALECWHRWIRTDREPVFTRYTVGVLAKSQTLNIEAAMRDLHYRPRVSVDEGIRRFISWYKQTKAADPS